MQRFFDIVRRKFSMLTSREPGIRFGGDNGRDWLPPVMGASAGLGEWPQGLMAGMADGNATWYFDRR